jgi:hypothetical protein
VNRIPQPFRSFYALDQAKTNIVVAFAGLLLQSDWGCLLLIAHGILTADEHWNHRLPDIRR